MRKHAAGIILVDIFQLIKQKLKHTGNLKFLTSPFFNIKNSHISKANKVLE